MHPFLARLGPNGRAWFYADQYASLPSGWRQLGEGKLARLSRSQALFELGTTERTPLWIRRVFVWDGSRWIEV